MVQFNYKKTLLMNDSQPGYPFNYKLGFLPFESHNW